MLKNRIIQTLKFFDLQEYPLTLLELGRFLLSDTEALKAKLDAQFDLKEISGSYEASVPTSEILACLETECREEVCSINGFYYLKGREFLIQNRQDFFLNGFVREKRIWKYVGYLKYIPFVRAAALGGSQAMGRQNKDSDIDLLIMTDERFMYLARTLVTAFFHILGVRRHNKKVANRFCLNHYLAKPKFLQKYQNLYTAMEYGRLRPLWDTGVMAEFQTQNSIWIKIFFPNWAVEPGLLDNQAWFQKAMEKILFFSLGNRLERVLKNWQEPKFKKEKFIVIEKDELSFHPESKQEGLLRSFFNSI